MLWAYKFMTVYLFYAQVMETLKAQMVTIMVTTMLGLVTGIWTVTWIMEQKTEMETETSKSKLQVKYFYTTFNHITLNEKPPV